MFDGIVRDWEPEPEPEWPFRGCYVVIPHFGPRGGRGPYKGRWTIEATYPGGWRPIACVIARNATEARFIASAILFMRGSDWWR